MKLNYTLKSKMLLGGIFVALGTSSLAHASEPVFNAVKIKEVNQIIQKNGAQWKAAETWVSKLSEDEVKKMLGAPAPKFQADFSADYSSEKAELPAAIDWRNKDGFNWMGQVLNQGNCGSCVAFASVATLNAQVAISSQLPWLAASFSPQQLFACGGAKCEQGWSPSSATSFLKNTGIVDAACAPYTMGSTGDDVACAATTTSCTDAKARLYKISASTSVGNMFSGASANKVKQLLQKGPVVTTLTVYADFLTYSGGIYKTTGGKALGGHAMSIVGYDDATRVWIVKNSWGADWGENGYIRFSWDDTSGIASEAIHFDVPAKNEFMTVLSPAENEYLSGSYNAKISSNGQDNVNLEVRKAGSKAAITSLSCARADGSSCVSALNTATLADGRYEILAKSGNTNAFSQARSFYVVNQAPTNLGIQFVGHGVDLSKPQKDRIEFDITTTSGAAPLHSITFVVRQNGKVIAQRMTDVVLPKMKLGFRTNSVPNGVYEILFQGEMTAAGKVLNVDSNQYTVEFKN